MTNDNNHEPLHDREAERAVLGAMLIDTDVIPCIPSARSKTLSRRSLHAIL